MITIWCGFAYMYFIVFTYFVVDEDIRMILPVITIGLSPIHYRISLKKLEVFVIIT